MSVIIPCYNCSAFIARAVESVMSQTGLPSEIILIDDGSDDNLLTLKAIQNLKKKYKSHNIIILQMPSNKGPASARNKGWDYATQPYLAFLDADDTWHPEKLSIQYEWMTRHPDILLTSHNTLQLENSVLFPKVEIHAYFIKVNLLKLILFNCLPMRTIMLKRDVEYRFLPDKRYAEDYHLWLLIALDGHSIYYLNQPLSYSVKNDFGDLGLTSDIYKTHHGLIDTYRQLLYSKKISTLLFLIVICFEHIKLSRRYIIIFSRKLFLL